MTIDDLKALAEKAKAWRPYHWCSYGGFPTSDVCGNQTTKRDPCSRCGGVQRACEDISETVDFAMTGAHNYDRLTDPEDWKSAISLAVGEARDAARIAGFFGPEDTPVHVFRDAVKEFCSK